jgi:hypothetical protein
VNRDFLWRSYRTTAVLLGLLTPFVMMYAGPRFALGLLAGAVLGVLNLSLVEGLVVNWLRPQGARVARVALAAALKLALVFGAGGALLARRMVDPVPLAMGFPLVLAVIFFKALGRMYLARAGVAPLGQPAVESQGKERR